MRDEFIIRLPATAANLGPGFDCLAIALTLYNDFHVRASRGNAERADGHRTTEHRFEVQGFGAGTLSSGATDNLFLRAYESTCARHRMPVVPLHVAAHNRIPLQSGIGSSATAIIGGVVAAYQVHGLMRDYLRIVEDALVLESHPDNISACLYGGFTAAVVSDGGPLVSKTEVHYPLAMWLLHPARTVNTEESRARLPASIARPDVVFSLSRACLLTSALIKGEMHLLYEGMKDQLHEPFRMDPLMEYPVLKAKLRGDEFYGWAVSGSGPSVVAMCAEITPRLEALAAAHFRERGVDYTSYKLRVDNQGLRLFTKDEVVPVPAL